MSGFAVSEDGSFRAVDGKDDLLPGEKFFTSPPDIHEPTTDVERLRLIAYADPITGSDRYLAEAASLRAAGALEDDADVVMLYKMAIDRKAAIKEEFPYP
jgi:hypothetical protein